MKSASSDKTNSATTMDNKLVVNNLSHFRKIVEAITSSIFIIQGDNVCYANPCAESITGYSNDELMALPFWAIVHADFQALVKQRCRARQAGEDVPANYDFMWIRKDGMVRWVNWRASIISLHGKRAVMGIGDDITERKNTETALADSASNYRFITELSPNPILVHDIKGNILFANSACLSITCATNTQFLIGKNVAEFIHANMTELIKGDLKRCIEAGKSYQAIACKLKRLDDTCFDAEISAAPVTFNAQPAVMVIIQEVSQRKQAELFVKQTANIVEMVATGQPASGIYNAIALMYEARHPGMRCSMLTLKGDKLLHAGAPSLPAAYCNAVNGLKNGSNIGSCCTSTYSGKRVLVEEIATDPKWTELKGVALSHGLRSCWSEPIINASGKVIGAFGMYYNHPALPNEVELDDLQSAANLAGIVMNRERREEQVNKLSQAIEQAGESVVITDKQGVIEYVNPTFTRLTGYSPEEAIGQTPRLLNSGNQSPDFYKAMWKTISNGDIWHGKIIDKKKDGRFYPANLTISPIQTRSGSAGGHTHYVGIQSDLTQIEDMEHQFQQAQKMEAIGTLVGGIAHDFNNMLAGITGNIYLAKHRLQDMPEVVQKLDHVEDISMRAADMIQQLLTFARKDRVCIKPIPFTSFIKETLKLLRTSVPENIAVHEEICTTTLQVLGDTTQLHQVLMNLLNNARDALEGIQQPHILIRLTQLQVDETFTTKYPDAKSISYALLSVQDNGCGICKKHHEHLFEPFFTTKEQGKGTGLGLAMVFGAVKTHKGFVELESKQGEGSTFHIYLPLLQQAPVDSNPDSKHRASEHGQGETILFADDQDQVRETSQEVLEALGYHVLAVSNGQQAVEMFKNHADDIDLCILDIVMPIMNGTTAAQYIRQIKPDMKIIFSTGYDKLSRENIVNETVISKPFPIQKVSRLIRQQLDC